MDPHPSLPSYPTICHVLHSLHVGGAEILVAQLARNLAGLYRIVFVCLDELGTVGQDLQKEGFPVAVLGRRAGLDFTAPWRLAAFLRQQRVSLIHAHQYTPFFYSILARLIYHRPAVIFTEHGRHFPDYPRRKRILFNRLFVEKRDRVIGVGEAVRQALIHNEGFPGYRVKTIYNGIDLDPFVSVAVSEDDVRRELGLDLTNLVLIQVARLDYLKDHVTAVRTVARVKAIFPKVRLVLVGEGPERAKIEAEITRLGLTHEVMFLGTRPDVPRLLAAADQFLLTSISEGIPLTILEAMAMAKPVVATNVGGMKEVVIDGQTGLLAPSGNDSSLADAVVRLAKDPILCRQLGDAGKKRVRQFFSLDSMASAYADIYREQLAH